MRYLKRLIRHSYRALLGLIEAAREIKAERNIFGEDGQAHAYLTLQVSVFGVALGFMFYIAQFAHAML